MKKLLFLAAAWLSTGAARADWVGPYQAGRIEVGQTGIYFFKPAGLSAFPNTFGCSNNDWVFVDGSTPLANRVLAAGLAAQAQGRKINFLLVGCVGPYLQANAISIEPN